jgi:hypothetical protein
MIRKYYLILFFVFLYCNVFGQNRASWLKTAKWGVMTHYLADWTEQVYKQEITVEKWNELIDHFDVEGLARQLNEIGAGYYIITIGQNSGFYLSPNKMYDKITGIIPSRCSRRDLIMDIYSELNKYGIKLIVYLPAGAPEKDPIAVQKLAWIKGPVRNAEFQRKWEKVIGEWSSKWGKNIDGWWFDGCYWPNMMYRNEKAPNFSSFAVAARKGNNKSIVTFNPGVFNRMFSICPEEDYTAGEINNPELISFGDNKNGLVDGRQIHVLSFLGEKWGMGSPRFTNEQVANYSRNIWRKGGAITWDVPIQPSGLISDTFFKQLLSIGQTKQKE